MIQDVKDIINPAFFENECEKELKQIKIHQKKQSQLCRCPHCGSSHIVRNGTYVRKIGRIKEDNTVTSEEVKVQKHLCRNCDHPFNDIPQFLPNLLHFTVLSVFVVLVQEASNRSISEKYGISRTTVRNYKKKFSSDLKRLKYLIGKYNIDNVQMLIKTFIEIFPKNCFLRQRVMPVL